MSNVIKHGDNGNFFSPEKIELIKNSIAKNSTPDEFELFLHLAKKYNLDPLARQIYFVKYGTAPGQIFAGRDGFLDIAHRSGEFDGIATEIERLDEPLNIRYKDRDGWAEFRRGYQYIARTTVYRKNMVHPIVVEVYEEEYSTGQNLWKTKPRTMIQKVSESQALRKTFSISGLYDRDEIRDDSQITVLPNKTIDPDTTATSTQAEPDINDMGRYIADMPSDLAAHLRAQRWSLKQVYTAAKSVERNWEKFWDILMSSEVSA